MMSDSQKSAGALKQLLEGDGLEVTDDDAAAEAEAAKALSA